MQTVGQNITQRTSFDALQDQMDKINQRFSNIESVLQHSFQSILGILSQQKLQMDGMSVTLGNFKQDSLAMSQQIKSLLFSKKTKVEMSLLEQGAQHGDCQPPQGNFLNGFQLNRDLNQIKISEEDLQKSHAESYNISDIYDTMSKNRQSSIDMSMRLNHEIKKGLQISFEPLVNKKSIKSSPMIRGKSMIISRKSLLRFETPQGVKEMRNKKVVKKRDPPKLKNRSVISKKRGSGRWAKKKIQKSRKKKQVLRKANLNLLADKLGQLEFGNEDLRSRESDSFQESSHFLDRVSQDHSKNSLRLRMNDNQYNFDPPSLGIFTKTPTNQTSNFPKPRINVISNSFDGKNSTSNSDEITIMVPSLHLESINHGGSKHRSELKSEVIREKKEIMRTPSIGKNPNLSIFSVNRKQATLNSSNQMKMIPLLPNLHSEVKIEQQEPKKQTHIPNFNFCMEDSEDISQYENPKIFNNITNYQKPFIIRDPLVGEKTPSSINHSKLQKNLNAIKFDFSYHTGYETKESKPEFAQFESKESSRYDQSKFDITPQQNQGLFDHFPPNKNLNRNWSINPIPKSAYLHKVRNEFPEMKNGLKLNEKGQMSIDDSAFSTEMNLKFLNINTVKSSLNKLNINPQPEEAEQGLCWNEPVIDHKINKKLDFQEEDDNNSVRTMNQVPNRKPLPDFECSGFEESMFTADLDGKDSHLTRKNNEQEDNSYGPFNLREELQKLPTNDFFGMDFKVPGIQSQTNDSQFNMSLLEQLDFKEDYVNESISTNVVPQSNHLEVESDQLVHEKSRFEKTLKELKTQLDAAHYQMFDSKFDTKFEELTRKLREYCLLDSDVHRVDLILKNNNQMDHIEELEHILKRRNIRTDPRSVLWNEKVGRVCQSMQTLSFEESLHKLMADPSGFNSFLILVKKRLSEQEILFQNSF